MISPTELWKVKIQGSKKAIVLLLILDGGHIQSQMEKMYICWIEICTPTRNCQPLWVSWECQGTYIHAILALLFIIITIMYVAGIFQGLKLLRISKFPFQYDLLSKVMYLTSA